MDELTLKGFAASFTVKDEERGEVEAVLGEVNVVDKDADVFLPGSTPEGARVKLSYYQHDVYLKAAPPVGAGTVTEEDGKIVLRARYFTTTERGREAFNMVKEMGTDSEWSIGFPNRSVKTAPMTDDWQARGARRLIAAYVPKEASPVFEGAQFNTQTLSVKSVKAADDSLTGRIEAVHEALFLRNDSLPKPWWAREVFEDHIIVTEDYGKTLRVPYTMDGETVVLGEPQEVEIVYQPVTKASEEEVETKAEDEPVETKEAPPEPEGAAEGDPPTDPPEPAAEEPAPVQTKSAEEVEAEALGEVVAGLAVAEKLSSALDAADSGSVELKRLRDDLAAKRAQEEALDRTMAEEFERFERTRKRLGVG